MKTKNFAIIFVVVFLASSCNDIKGPSVSDHPTNGFDPNQHFPSGTPVYGFSTSINDTVEISVKGTDDNGNIEKYYWALDGRNFNDSTTEGSIKTVFSDSGIYAVPVKVRGKDGVVSDEDEIVITVNLDIPVPNAGADTAVAINTVINLEGAAFQQFGIIEMYKWDFDGDGIYDDSSASSGNMNHTYTHEAVYKAKFYIRDDDGNDSTDVRLITVVNRAPVISFIRADTVISIKDSITFFASASDNDGTIAEYAWDFDGNGSFDYTGSGIIKGGHRFNKVGIYNAILRVTDDDNKPGYDTAVISVRLAPPILVPANDTITSQNDTVRITVSATDSNSSGSVQKYYWDKGGDGWDDSTDVPQYDFSLPAGGWLRAAWGARDDDGVISVDTFNILFNRPPSSVSMINPSIGKKAEWVGFTGRTETGGVNCIFSASDPDGSSDTLIYMLFIGKALYHLSHVYSGNKDRTTVQSLDTSTTYYWKLVVKDLYGDSAIVNGSFITPPSPPHICKNGIFQDIRDNKQYKCVNIGTQTWMGENLAYLPQVDGVAAGSEDISSGRFYYVYGYAPSGVTEAEQVANAKADSNYKTYGVLYNWNAAMNGAGSSSASPSGVQGACPPGWHLPSDDEWKILEVYLGMSQAAADSTGFRGTTEGQKLKAVSFGGTDDFGFTALPAAYRYKNGKFKNLGFRTYLWAATEKNAKYAWDRSLLLKHNDIARHTIADKNIGFSVRCLEDQ